MRKMAAPNPVEGRTDRDTRLRLHLHFLEGPAAVDQHPGLQYPADEGQRSAWTTAW